MVRCYDRDMEKNDEQQPDDHVMSSDELYLTNASLEIERSQQIIREAIARERSRGQLSDEAKDRERILEQKLIDLETQKKFVLMLEHISDPDERIAAEVRFYREGYPPEIFKEKDNFVIEGTNLPQ